MTITIDEFEKILDETYDRMFGDLTKITNEVINERKDLEKEKDVKSERHNVRFN